jgi:cell division protein FtsI/penicillin-binding protein 2
VTAALALEAGVVEPDELIDCQRGKGEFLGRIVNDHDDKLGEIPFSEVIAHSSNVGTVTVAIRLGKEALFKGIQRFGYGEATGIDLPGETRGQLRPLKDWSRAALASYSFGQGMSCNALRVAVTYAAFANGGKDVVPHVLKEGRLPKGKTVPTRTRAEPRGRMVSGGTCDKLVPMLEAVVDHGSGTPVAFPGFRVAGKTGPSQKFDQATHRYLLHQNYASFAGFVPSRDPRLLAVVVLDEPKGLTLGGWTSGPVFREALSAMVALLDISPDRGEKDSVVAQSGVRQIPGADKDPRRPLSARQAAPVEWVTVPKLEGVARREAAESLQEKNLRFRRLGDGPVVLSQFPQAGKLVRTHSSVRLLMGKPAQQLASARAAK